MICSFATDAAHNFLCWENHISRHILLQLKIRSAGYPVSNTCFAGGSEQTLRLARLWDLTQEAKSTHFSPVQDAWAVQSHPHTAATESGSASLETSVMPWWTLLVYYHYKAMKTSIWSAYFITTLWEHRVLLRVNLHEATEKRILFYTSICLPHCPPRNCHLRRLPKFYILGQLLLKNKKREGKKKKYLDYEQNKPNLPHVPLLHMEAAQKYSGQLLAPDHLEAHAAAVWWPLPLYSSPQSDQEQKFTA